MISALSGVKASESQEGLVFGDKLSSYRLRQNDEPHQDHFGVTNERDYRVILEAGEGGWDKKNSYNVNFDCFGMAKQENDKV